MDRLARRITQWHRKEINELFRSAQLTGRTKEFIVRKVRSSKPHGRILLVVSRYVGNAPERNKIRRQIKAIFYENQLFNQGFDWLFIVRKSALNLSFQDLKNLVLTLCSQPFSETSSTPASGE